MSRQVTLSHSIYPHQCMERAIEAYQSICNVRVCDTNNDRCSLLIEALMDVDEQELAHEFLNYVLDVSLEWHLRRL